MISGSQKGNSIAGVGDYSSLEKRFPGDLLQCRASKKLGRPVFIRPPAEALMASLIWTAGVNRLDYPTLSAIVARSAEKTS